MSHSRLPAPHLDNARRLRRNLTPAERILWRALRARQFAAFKFRRQHPLGPFVLDFFCSERQLAIELDGGGHAEASVSAYDAERTSWLASRGIRELRFWNTDVHGNLDGVLQAVATALTGVPSPGPLSASRPLPRGEAK